MDYEKLAAAIKLCGSTPKVDQCRECLYWSGGDMSECIPRMTADAATAITDLLSRAAAAEARAEKAERERDAAVADLRLVSDCRTCGNVSPWCIDNPDKCKGWEWRGRKEE